MKLPRPFSACVFGLTTVFLFTLAGCTRSRPIPPVESNLRDLAKYYGMYQSQNQGRTPPDEKRFKEFIQKQSASANLEEVFTSPRDQQPYVVIYNVKAGPPDPAKGAPVIAYEKTGVGGKHMVARSTTQVEELDADTLKQLVKMP